MNTMTIEFFHDVICSFCFPMSFKMRRIQRMMPEVSIVHRSYALTRDARDYDLMFGSREAARAEILTHWAHANKIDDLHRFNIEGMKRTSFPFPTSIKALLACKAAFFAGGEAAYWDAFDALQSALFVQSRDIGDERVIEEAIKETGLDLDRWRRFYKDEKTAEAMEKDIALAEAYGIDSVPCLIVNGTHKISGALPVGKLIDALQTLAGTETESQEGGACSLGGGKMECR